MTLIQLKQYDGTGEEGRVCVAVNGKVYDVTKGKRFYGPGKQSKDALLSLLPNGMQAQIGLNFAPFSTQCLVNVSDLWTVQMYCLMPKCMSFHGFPFVNESSKKQGF